MFCADSNRKLKKCSAYEFQMYGGRLPDSLCFIAEGRNDDEENKKLIEMFSFRRNAFVIIDSDAVERDGVVVDKTSFWATKELISKQFNELNRRGFKLGMRFDEGDTRFNTIEDYLLPTDPVRPKSRSKTVMRTEL